MLAVFLNIPWGTLSVLMTQLIVIATNYNVCLTVYTQAKSVFWANWFKGPNISWFKVFIPQLWHAEDVESRSHRFRFTVFVFRSQTTYPSHGLCHVSCKSSVRHWGHKCSITVITIKAWVTWMITSSQRFYKVTNIASNSVSIAFTFIGKHVRQFATKILWRCWPFLCLHDISRIPLENKLNVPAIDQS